MASALDIDVGSYAPADRSACLGIFDSNVPAFFAPSERTGFAEFLDWLPGPFWVARDRSTGTVVGCAGVTVTDDGRTAWLRWGMVDAGRHRRGIGHRLIEARLRWIRTQPLVRTVRIATTGQASGFFVREGFHLTTATKNHYGPGLDRCDLERKIV